MPDDATHAELVARHRYVMPSWMALYYEDPIEIVSGSGRRVTDGGGREYLDFFAGILTNPIGYDIAEISAAVRAQLSTRIAHTSTAYLIPPHIDLAQQSSAPSGTPATHAPFPNSAP